MKIFNFINKQILALNPTTINILITLISEIFDYYDERTEIKFSIFLL